MPEPKRKLQLAKRSPMYQFKDVINDANNAKEAGQYKRQKTETTEIKAPQKPKGKGMGILEEINDINEVHKSKDTSQAPVSKPSLEDNLVSESEFELETVQATADRAEQYAEDKLLLDLAACKSTKSPRFKDCKAKVLRRA
jgi:hypothetical protein